MIQNFNISNIKGISLEEKKLREESLRLFEKSGFPNKRIEEWKFTDLNKIITNNFKEISTNNLLPNIKNIEKLKDFDHNFIVLIDGKLDSKNFKHEDEKSIIIENYKNDPLNNASTQNPLLNLNNALHEGGFFLEISSNYKVNKPLVIYNYFSNNIQNKIVNNKNSIVLNENSELKIVEFNLDSVKENYIQNNHTNIKIYKNSSLKNYTVQGCKSNGFYYKFIKCSLSEKANYEDYIFSSGLKFNRIEEDIDIIGEESNCTIQSALSLDTDSHQEIKTQINHLKPNCTSYQKIKNVLNKNCKGAYQGKIFVKDVAQKTDAYQLSKALILNESSEFNAKPELEIYADDVKCSHGSTSGSINEDSIYYLMSRGITRKNAIELLIKAFLFEVADSIKDEDIKKFIEKNLDSQIYGY